MQWSRCGQLLKYSSGHKCQNASANISPERYPLLCRWGPVDISSTAKIYQDYEVHFRWSGKLWVRIQSLISRTKLEIGRDLGSEVMGVRTRVRNKHSSMRRNDSWFRIPPVRRSERALRSKSNRVEVQSPNANTLRNALFWNRENLFCTPNKVSW